MEKTSFEDKTIPCPDVVLDLLSGFRRSKIMFAAVKLGVFDALQEGALSSKDLATKIGCDESTLERLLNACVGLELVTSSNDSFANSPSAATYLTQNSPRRMTGYINYSNDVMWGMWGNLEGAIREGTHRWKETFGWDEPIFSSFFKDEHAMREFLMGMHGFGKITSPVLVNAVDLSRFEHMVDLGGATGHWSIAACERWANLRATVFDLPNAISLANEIVPQSFAADRISVVGGDFFSDDLPKGDLYALGRILHDWDEPKIIRLLTKIFDTLPAGGAVMIGEKMLLESMDGPPWAQMQDLNMLVVTEGRERSLSQYAHLLSSVGFSRISGCRTSAPLDVILAIKPDA